MPEPLTIRQHIPNFIAGFERGVASFETLADLISVPFVRSWTLMPGFHRFSLAGPVAGSPHPEYELMAEIHDGDEWWVVGTISDAATDLGLPVWRAGESVVRI